MLLKEITKHPELKDTLEIWDEKLVKFGVSIIKERFSYLERLQPIVEEIYHGISSQNGLDPGFYLQNVKWLGDVIIGSVFQT